MGFKDDLKHLNTIYTAAANYTEYSAKRVAKEWERWSILVFK
jgi:hypothetical protein